MPVVSAPTHIHILYSTLIQWLLLSSHKPYNTVFHGLFLTSIILTEKIAAKPNLHVLGVSFTRPQLLLHRKKKNLSSFIYQRTFFTFYSEVFLCSMNLTSMRQKLCLVIVNLFLSHLNPITSFVCASLLSSYNKYYIYLKQGCVCVFFTLITLSPE